MRTVSTLFAPIVQVLQVSHFQQEVSFCHFLISSIKVSLYLFTLDNKHANSAESHTVVPYSIATRRLMEIYYFKANECKAKVGMNR